jgi:SAM-dependent methyltransferase
VSLGAALREAQPINGWDWSRCRTRMGPLGWDYVEVLRSFVPEYGRVLDVGTGGGEVYASVARPTDVALDVSLDMLAVARRRLPCPVVAADHADLPFRASWVDVVADRHVGADPREVLRCLRPGGVYVTQHPGGRICQSIFDAFGWGSNGDFWKRHYAEAGRPLWDVDALATFYADAGCTIVRRSEADVDYEFLDEESLAFWLNSAPLPEKVDPDEHAEILEHLELKTNWHAELLVVRRPE